MAEGTELMRVGGPIQALAPQTFEEMWRVSGILHEACVAPKDINSREKVCAVIMAGAEVGLAPFQSLQSFAIINGRLSLWGDGMLAVVRAQKVRVSERIDGEGEAMVAVCKATRPDTGEEIERTFSVFDAKKAGLWTKQGPWTQYPKRMLQMRARAWALRDGCADLLRGIPMAEEVQDVEVVSNERIVEQLPFINGAEKDRLIEDWVARLRQTTAPEDIEQIMAEAETYKSRLSKNAWDGLEHIAEQETHRVCEGIAPRAPLPSPFEELKAAGLECLTAADPKIALAAWMARSRAKANIALCTPEERTELRTLEKTLKAEIEGAPAK